jgi:hypothetical protein
MKSKLSVTGLLLAIGTGASANGQVATPPPYVAPLEPSTMSVVLNDKGAQGFAGVLRASALTPNDLPEKETTYLVPRDSSCSGGELAHVKSLTSKNAAKAYVLGHVFKGSLSVIRDDVHNHAHVLSVSYFSEEQNIQGRGRVQIDETHPFAIRLLDGSTALLSIRQGAIYIGATSAVLDNFSGGRKVDLDHCATF